ncbi:uncharacterized protein METZ01_LOCUS161932, partial [marine metagenome]
NKAFKNILGNGLSTESIRVMFEYRM